MTRPTRSIATLVSRGQWQSAGVALLCVSVLMLVVSFVSLHEFAGRATDLAARTLAFAGEPALRFKDLDAMREMAQELADGQQLAEVSVFDRDGRLWMRYDSPSPGRLNQWAAAIDRMLFPQPARAVIESDGQVEGAIALRSNGQFLLRYLAWALSAVLLGVALTAVAILAVSRRLSRAIVEPVDRLAALTRRVGTSRSFEHRAEATSVREIDALAEDFNGLLAELQVQQRKVVSRHNHLRRANDVLRHASRHDGLTQLPNRMYLMEHLGQVLARCSERQQRAAVLFIDVDKFKAVNDSLGHEAGDALLIELAGRLQSSLRETDFVSRLGGDEFVVVISPVTELSEVDRCVERLRAAMAPAWQFKNGTRLSLEVTIGRAIYPDQAQSVDELIRCADAAMYVAKTDTAGWLAQP